MIKTYKDFLHEKRSHPELNPKLTPYEELKQYKDDKDIYITFTLFNKVGLNPRSDFKTPNGIYTYQLKEFWPMITHKFQLVYTDKLFGTDRRYIQILKAKKSKKFIEDISKDYTSSMLTKDIAKIGKLYGKTIPNIEVVIDEAKKTSKDKSPGGIFWNITRWIANDGVDPGNNSEKVTNKQFTFKWATIFAKLGYSDGIGDRAGKGIIHPSEPKQAVFFNKKAFNHVATIDRSAGKPENFKDAGKADAEFNFRQRTVQIDDLTYYLNNSLGGKEAPVLQLGKNGKLEIDFTYKEDGKIQYMPSDKLQKSIAPTAIVEFIQKRSWDLYEVISMLQRHDWVYFQLLKQFDKVFELNPTLMKKFISTIAVNERWMKSTLKSTQPILYKYIKKYLYTNKHFIEHKPTDSFTELNK